MMLENVISETQNDPRFMRGYEIIARGDEPQMMRDDWYQVPSQNGNTNYHVVRRPDGWKCSCPDAWFRGVQCKHTHAVKFWLALKEKLAEEAVEEPHGSNMVCKFCHSTHVIKYGFKGRKQVYKCKGCDRKFVPDDGGGKYDPRIITLCLDLYFKGVSLRKISDHLRQFHEVKVNFSTIYRWIEKYIRLMTDYLSTLKPELGDTWMTDEMMVKVGGDWTWLWNTIDMSTRFQLVSVVTRERQMKDARMVFMKAKQVGGKKPKFMRTDGLYAYKRAFKKVFYDHHQSSKHIQLKNITHRENTNAIERMQGSIRDREKTMRGLKIENTPIVDGHQVYYNYIRRHMGLDGKTPAQEAGIELELGDNRWLGLLKKSLEQKNYHV